MDEKKDSKKTFPTIEMILLTGFGVLGLSATFVTGYLVDMLNGGPAFREKLGRIIPAIEQKIAETKKLNKHVADAASRKLISMKIDSSSRLLEDCARIHIFDDEKQIALVRQKLNKSEHIIGHANKIAVCKLNAKTYALDRGKSDKSWRDIFKVGMPTNAFGFAARPKAAGVQNRAKIKFSGFY